MTFHVVFVAVVYYRLGVSEVLNTLQDHLFRHTVRMPAQAGAPAQSRRRGGSDGPQMEENKALWKRRGFIPFTQAHIRYNLPF